MGLASFERIRALVSELHIIFYNWHIMNGTRSFQIETNLLLNLRPPLTKLKTRNSHLNSFEYHLSHNEVSQRPPKASEKLWEAFRRLSEQREGPLEAPWGPMAVSKLLQKLVENCRFQVIALFFSLPLGI